MHLAVHAHRLHPLAAPVNPRPAPSIASGVLVPSRLARLTGRFAPAVVLTALAAPLVAVAPAQAAPTCWGATCNGRSPVGTTCANDARTLDSFNVVLGEGASYGDASWKVELRYSPSCAAAWTRATGKVSGTHGAISFTVKIGAWSRLNPALPVSSTPTHYQAERVIKYAGLPSFQFSTAMVNDNRNYQVRSCSSAWSSWPCTPYQHL